MDVKLLMIDDDEIICKQIKALFDGETIGEDTLHLEYKIDFDDGMQCLKDKPYDIVILDLYKGVPSDENPNKDGENVLQQIKQFCFIPVIFFTGLIRPVESLKSDIIRVVRKGDGNEALLNEVKSVCASGLPLLKRKFETYVNESMRSYFWDFVLQNWASFKDRGDDTSLGYLLIRRLANSLSKEQIKKLINDPNIKVGKSHPMEFYVYPYTQDEYELGDVLKKDGAFFIVLTPTCDFVKRDGVERKAKEVMLVQASLLTNSPEYQAYKSNQSSKNKENLSRCIRGTKSDQYFFLPHAFAIPNCILDFQKILMIKFSELEGQYTKIAKLDDPYAQSMLASFIRYYNRIGHEDIDLEYVFDNIDK